MKCGYTMTTPKPKNDQQFTTTISNEEDKCEKELEKKEREDWEYSIK